MFIAMALVGIAIGSLRYTNEAWLAVVIGVTMALLFWALIVAAVDRGSRQAFALAMALTMIAYGIVLISGYRVSGTSGAVTSRNIEFDHWEGRLPTTRILRFVHQAVDRSHWVQVPNTLQTGDSDGLVYSLQLTLNNRIVPSPNIAVDGDFGGETFRAVQRFQSQAGLPTTGTVDATTWQALGPLIDAQTGKALPPFNSAATVAAPAAGIAVVGGGSFQEDPPREIFMPIGHGWWAVLLGYFGGLFGLVVYRRRKRDAQPEAAVS
jgi:hypothetical protein